MLGDRAGALQEYALFAARMREEFETEPSPDTKAVFEAAKISPVASTNVPLETSSFIGRTKELDVLSELLGRSRMVTITGPGGVGKSRTARHYARKIVESFPDGVWLVEVGPHATHRALVHALAAAVGFHDLVPAGNLGALAQRLRERRVLLVLDNIETLLDPCAQVCEAILESCAEPRILATSREPLGIEGEAILRLSPFDDDAEAMELFCDRARAADASFQLTDETRGTIAEICRRLDRLPLATELAAVRVATLPPDEILERLHDRFALLKRTRAPSVQHHQTLRATIAWSHDLLSIEEKTLFRRLAIFPSSWMLSAAEAICGDSSIERAAVLDILCRLVDKSLIYTVSSEHGRRFRFLDSIREYALAELYASADTDSLRERYLAYYTAVGNRSAKELSGAHQRDLLHLLQEERDNLLTAMQLGEVDPRHATASLQIACDLQPFWLIRGHFSEGRRWVERALDAVGADVAPELRANALSAAAMLASFTDDRAAAQRLERQALELRTACSDESGIAQSLNSLGCYAFDVGEFERAMEFFSQALESSTAIGDQGLTAKAMDNVGVCATALGDFERAAVTLHQSLEMYRRLEDAYGTAWVLEHLAWLAERKHEYSECLKLHEQSLEIRERLDARHGIACSFLGLARCYEALGERERALHARRRCITIWRELRYTVWLTEAFENYGCAEATLGDAERAVTLLGAAEQLRALCAKALPAYEQGEHDEALQKLEAVLGEQRLRAALGAGGSMPLESMTAFALAQ